jgi:hypothetical protein
VRGQSRNRSVALFARTLTARASNERDLGSEGRVRSAALAAVRDRERPRGLTPTHLNHHRPT